MAPSTKGIKGFLIPETLVSFVSSSSLLAWRLSWAVVTAKAYLHISMDDLRWAWLGSEDESFPTDASEEVV
jgi:hypothetical protein